MNSTNVKEGTTSKNENSEINENVFDAIDEKNSKTT